MPLGTIVNNTLTTDVIFGLQGEAFLRGDRWYVPYYLDGGFGAISSTWQAYTGAGYTFDHGQSLLFTWRTLNYYAFPPTSPVKKLTMYGPLLGYLFGL